MVDFARPARELHKTPLGDLAPTKDPAGGRGLSLDDKARLPEEIENARIRAIREAGSNQSSFTETGTGYAGTATTNAARITLPDGLQLYLAGFRPYVFLCARMSNSGASTTLAQVSIDEIAENDSGSVSIGTGAEISHAGATTSFEHSGWTEIAVTPGTDDHWIVLVQTRVTGGTGTYNDVGLLFQWR